MIKILDFTSKYNIPLVYASSSAVYGNLPIGNDKIDRYDLLSPYSIDKLTLERYSKICYDIFGNSSLGLRFFNVYGPRQDPSNPYSGVISIFIDRLLNKKEVTLNGGHQTRDFVYVSDVVEALSKSMNYVMNNKICNYLNVGTGTSVSISELLEKISSIIEFKPKIVRKPLLKSDPEKSTGTYSKMKEILNIDNEYFLDIEQGLIKTVNFFKLN